jgi:branched-chain amino acid transport system substrate-binding protein
MAARRSALPVGATRRSVLAAGFLGGVAATVDACASRRTTAVPDRPTLPAGEDLVFGACLELTGLGSVAGTAQQRALKIAQDTLNLNGVTIGGTVRKVQVIVRDSGSDPATAAGIANELVGRKVLGIIGGGLAATARAMAGVVEPRAVPLLSTSAADSVIRPLPDRRFVFKLGPNAADVAALMRTRLAGKGRVAVLAEASDHGDAGLAAVTDLLRDLGPRLVAVERLPQGAADYHAQATRINAASPDAVVIWAVAPVSGLAARSLRGAGFAGTLLFDAGAASDESLATGNRTALENSYLVSPQILGGTPVAVNTPNAAAQREFFDQYTRAYGAFSCLGVYAADALNLLTGAASRGGGTTPLRIRNELEATPYDGLAGAYVFSTASHGGVQSDALALFALQRGGNWAQAS